MFFIGDHFVITVRHGKGSPLTAIRSEVEARPEFLELGPWAVVYSILDRIVDQYIAIASQFDIAIASLEANVFSEERRNMSKNIYFLKREVIEYRHAVEPLLLPMQRVYLESDSLIPKELIPFFGDLNDHLIRACETSAGLDALLTTVLQADLVHVQLRQNDDVRKISSWVALAAGPTMIAGIYGMNFHNIPELKWKYGYFIVLGLMASLTGFIFYKLKKSKWL
jgi:magnesium transporter